MTSSPPESSSKWPRNRVLVIAAEVLLVLALVVLNLYLWIRPGGDTSAQTDAASAASSAPNASSTAPSTALTSGATTAGSSAPSPAASSTPATATNSAATTPASPTSPAIVPPATGGSAAPSTGAVDPAAALKNAGRLVVVLDTSAAMAPHLNAVKAGLSDLIRQTPDGVTLGLLTYSPAGPQIVSAPAAMDAGRREALTSTVNGLSTADGAGRPMFDALVLAYQQVLAGTPGADPAPILMTITNGGSAGGADLQTFLTFAQAESAKRARSADPVFLGITPGADVPLLRQVTANLGGRVVSVASDDQIRTAILDLPTPALAHRP